MRADRGNAVARELNSSRRKLLETGTRNRLVHVNRANQRANCLNVINEHSDPIFEILRRAGKRMRFKAMGKDKSEEGGEAVLAAPDPEIEEGSDRLTDDLIETPLGPEALARRLLRLAGDARTAEEEQGLNILYLAQGFLRWRESESSEVWREAPLLLIPVQLVRNERTSTYDIRARDDDISTNLPLRERLRQDFGIALPEVEETDDWLPSRYFRRVAESISGKPEWSIDVNGMQIGFFSFAKLLMHRDLDPANWPEGELAGNGLLTGLLTDGFEAEEPLFGPQDKLDEHLDPAKIIQVVDADASQTIVIEEARRGSCLVVQGPPGTGKSQTITNIIAAAAHDGRTVLFVAEKMAALSVVYDRLRKSGLGDICLELHSRKANKKAFAQELGRTLAASSRPVPDTADPERLRRKRDELNRISNLLHSPIRPGGDSPFQAISEIIGFMGAGAPPPSIPRDGLEALDREARERALAAIAEFQEALEGAGPPDEHPFKGTRSLFLQPTDLDRLGAELEKAAASVTALLDEAGRLARILHLREPDSLAGIGELGAGISALTGAPDATVESAGTLFDHVFQKRLDEALRAGAEWASARKAAEGKFAATAWDVDPGSMRGGIAAGRDSLLSRIMPFGGYRAASTALAGILSIPLPKPPEERLALVDELSEVRAKRSRLADDEDWLRGKLGDLWRGERTDFASLLAVATWLAKAKRLGMFSEAKSVEEALDAFPDPEESARDLDSRASECGAAAKAPIDRLDLDLAEAGIGGDVESASLSKFAGTCARMAADTGRYGEWARLSRGISAVEEHGAGAIVEAVRGGGVEPGAAAREFSYACAEARWNAARAARQELNMLAGTDRHEIVRTFRELEKERIDGVKNLVLSRHFDQMPRGTMGEMKIIRGEIGRKRGHKSVRWIMENAGSMVQRIKPVMLMSPISVAQFLPAGKVRFDLLVIDEASQVRPEDALGVVLRAEQAVVVGDQKQLPPTSFFDRLVDEGDEDEDEEGEVPIGATAADMESILSLCETRGLRQRMLEWHYRSRDPSLIRVSNAEFYDDNLVLLPSPLQLDDDYGLRFTRVPGVYSRGAGGTGRRGTNRIEAEAVVQAVARHARDWPDLSLGVVAFSKTQSDMLTEVMEIERRRDAVLDKFLREGYREDVFVKNIENVQGDERDVILISVGYGPVEPNGRLPSMSFGPVNGEGGERRLNVLFSRARARCEVFASFDPGDIDLERTKRDGPRVLKRFLEFAKSGRMAEHAPSGEGADSPFEEDVASVVRSLGYLADPQVGTAGFRIDIGVRHPDRPGQYLLAVECDGAAYHSALWARERDRLRQEVLENLGWRFHRIWSTDWFHHRNREVERLRGALENAKTASLAGIRVPGANRPEASPTPEPPETSDDTEPASFLIDQSGLTAPAYVRAAPMADFPGEPHEAPPERIAEMIVKIVEVEGPVHMDEVVRRVAEAFGKSRAGGRIADAVKSAADMAARNSPSLSKAGEFLLTRAQAEDPPVRDRSSEQGSLLKAAYLPPMEIRAAAARIALESGEMPRDDMVRAVSRLMGFKRVGSDLEKVINDCLNATEGG